MQLETIEQIEHPEALSSEEVLRFLMLNPDFFNRHDAVLARLQIPHQTGEAVSLIEKQVSVLRNKCSHLENSLRDLIHVARDNEQLHLSLHKLIQDIISSRSLANVVKLMRDHLDCNFNADEVQMVFFSDKAKPSKTKGSYYVVPKSDKGIALFSDVFKQGETHCGVPNESQLAFLRHGNTNEVGSAAIIPLFYKRQLGVIALTSQDESRFAADKGVLFLNQLGDVLSRRIDTLL